MSRPTAAEAPALPVAAHMVENGRLFVDQPVLEADEAERAAFKRQDGAIVSPLVRLSDAQAALDKLTAERDAALEHLARSEGLLAIAIKQNENADRRALKASPAVNVDEAMRLADEMVIAKATAEHANQYGSLSKWKLWTEAYDAAREALRAYLGGKP